MNKTILLHLSKLKIELQLMAKAIHSVKR